MISILLLLYGVALANALRGSSWQQYVHSPFSRSVSPSSIYRTTGDVSSRSIEDGPLAPFRLTGPNSSITYDFGRITAGLPTINFLDSSCPKSNCSTTGLPGFSCGQGCMGLGVGYTESARFVGPASDNSALYNHIDGVLYIPITNGSYTLPAKWGRGSFRYLTLSLPAQALPTMSVEIQLLDLHFTADPDREDLQTYSGHFWSSDDLLNKIWYAGAYTLQLCSTAPNSSVQHTRVLDNVGWSNDAQAVGLDSNETMLTDGAKRDRNPWAGDLNVALRSALITHNTDNLRSIRNTIRAIVALQDPVSGYFPYAGSPLGDLLLVYGPSLGIPAYGSDTYHLWAIAGYAEYVLTSGDIEFGRQYWPNMTRAVEGTYPYISNTTGLFNGTRTADWGRVGQGGENTALNALLSHTLLLMKQVSVLVANDSLAQANQWQQMAANVKTSMNKYLFDNNTGLFFDNTTAAGRSLYPQDGNVLAINFNITSPSIAARIAGNLAARLTRYGSPSPELPDSISPFIGSQELLAHFTATPGDASRALWLMRTQWGYMLSTFSHATFIEGYASDGSLNYGFYPEGSAFISHTHAWSTGPVYALQTRVLGLRASAIDVSEEDGKWVFQPAVNASGLDFASGGYQTKDGYWEAEWEVDGTMFSASVVTPPGLNGTIYVPMLYPEQSSLIVIDGLQVQGQLIGSFVRIANLTGGKHIVKVY